MVITTSAQLDLPAAAGLWVRIARALPVHPETCCPHFSNRFSFRKRRCYPPQALPLRSVYPLLQGGFGRDSRQAGADTAA